MDYVCLQWTYNMHWVILLSKRMLSCMWVCVCVCECVAVLFKYQMVSPQAIDHRTVTGTPPLPPPPILLLQSSSSSPHLSSQLLSHWSLNSLTLIHHKLLRVYHTFPAKQAESGSHHAAHTARKWRAWHRDCLAGAELARVNAWHAPNEWADDLWS